jgi:ATP-dependent protease HslVU (ClpYQ) peptidase subunit
VKHGTCIVGVAHKGAVWMGCDSMASSSIQKLPMREPKIFRVSELLVGICGALRVRDVVEFVTMPERSTNTESDREFLVRSYVPALRTALKDAGLVDPDDEEFGGDMLVAYKGKLFSIDSDFAVMEHREWATGSGGAYALGSLFSTSGEPQKRIKTALMAACEFSPSCGPPFVIEKL